MWYTYPFFMVIILGGLQSIPPDLYEAADVDGASWWQQLRNITLPLLRPAVLPAIVLSTLTTYKVDAVVWGITKGGPVKGAGIPGFTEFVMVHAYKQIFQTQAFGRMGAFRRDPVRCALCRHAVQPACHPLDERSLRMNKPPKLGGQDPHVRHSGDHDPLCPLPGLVCHVGRGPARPTALHL